MPECGINIFLSSNFADYRRWKINMVNQSNLRTELFRE